MRKSVITTLTLMVLFCGNCFGQTPNEIATQSNAQDWQNIVTMLKADSESAKDAATTAGGQAISVRDFCEDEVFLTLGDNAYEAATDKWTAMLFLHGEGVQDFNDAETWFQSAEIAWTNGEYGLATLRYEFAITSYDYAKINFDSTTGTNGFPWSESKYQQAESYYCEGAMLP